MNSVILLVGGLMLLMVFLKLAKSMIKLALVLVIIILLAGGTVFTRGSISLPSISAS